MSTSKATKGSAKPVVAVEIGPEWLKVIRAEGSPGNISITSLHLDKCAADPDALRTSLADALSAAKANASRVIGVLPRQSVNIRIFELPSTDPDEISDMVELQADKQTPHTKDEIVSDYRILGPGREGYTRVMLGIVQRGVLRQCYSVLEECGVEFERTSVSTEGLLGVLKAKGIGAGASSTMVLDVDAACSDLAIARGGTLESDRSILVGGDQLLEDSDTWQAKLAQEISAAIETAQSETQDAAPEKILLSGAGARIEGLAEFLAARLGMTVEPLEAMSVVGSAPSAPALGDPAYQALSITSLIGAALDVDALDFALTPDSVRLRRELVGKAKQLTTLGVMVASMLFAFSLFGVLRYWLKKGERDALAREYRATLVETRDVQRMQEVVNVVGERQDERRSVFNVLAELHPQVPDEVYFDVLDVDKEALKVTLNGSAPSRAETRALIQNLERSAMFTDVQEVSSNVDPRSNRLKFQIVCTLEKD